MSKSGSDYFYQSGGGSSGSAQVGVPSYNFLVNSAFDYWQVGTSATVTATGAGTPAATYLYQADQWYVNNILGGGTIEGIITFSQVAAVTNGSGFGASVKITTAPTGTGIQNGCELYQVLSNKASKPLLGQTASFTILVKALGNVNQVGVQFYSATSEAKPTTTIGAEVLTTVNSSTFVSCTINGQALGTGATAAGVIGVRIRITGVSSGNAYDLNNGFVVEQAMLNVGATAATWSRQYQDPPQELIACQYFYEKTYELTTAPGSATTTGDIGLAGMFNSATLIGNNGLSYRWGITKRVVPALTFYDPSAGTSGKVQWTRNNAAAAQATPNNPVISTGGFAQLTVPTTGATAGQAGEIEFHLVIDARI